MTRFCFLLVVILGLVSSNGAVADPLMTYPLTIGHQKLRVELAATPEDRQTGLMHRRSLGENQGMIFIFDRPGLWGMWMKNTYIPLSVAFIGENGRILNIEDMTPHTEDSHEARGPARYALEMNQGWFVKHSIKPGQQVEGLKALPHPR